MSERLCLRGLGLRRGRALQLAPFDLDVGAGEVVAVADARGLIARTIAGFPPRGADVVGEVHLDGESGHPANWRETGRLAFIPWNADRTFAPHLTIADLIDELPVPGSTDTRVRRGLVALEVMGLTKPDERLNDRPATLSSTDRWRIALALALALAPAAFLGEAVAAGLDATVRGDLLQRLTRRLRAEDAATILAGPPGSGLAAVADRVFPPRENPRLLAARVDPPDEGVSSPNALIVRDLRVAVPVGRSPRGAVRWLTVVDGVNFDLECGGSVAVLGESGSGKTMVARALTRLTKPSGGHITWRGRNLVNAEGAVLKTLRRDVRMLFPDPYEALDPLRRISRQLVEAADPGDAPDTRAVVEKAIARAGLAPALVERFPGELTPLDAARAGLARSLVGDPFLLVCDEPFARLSEAQSETFAEQLLGLNRAGLALVVATANARVAFRLARRILVMHGGRVVEDAPAVVLERDARHPLTGALMAMARGGQAHFGGDSAAMAGKGRGCPIFPRCPQGRPSCAGAPPALERVGPAHYVACHGAEFSDP